MMSNVWKQVQNVSKHGQQGKAGEEVDVVSLYYFHFGGLRKFLS